MKYNFKFYELIVVLVCSALLFTLAIGATGLSKEKADLVKCSSNQKGMYELMQKYCSANDNYYPSAYNRKTGRYWFGTLANLGKIKIWGKTSKQAPSIFSCPAVEACYATHGNNENGGLRYAVNYAYNKNMEESKVNVGITTELSNPSKVLLFADAPVIKDSKCTPKQTFYIITDMAVTNPRYGKLAPGFGAHEKNANICWADGHVSAESAVIRENIYPEWK